MASNVQPAALKTKILPIQHTCPLPGLQCAVLIPFNVCETDRYNLAERQPANGSGERLNEPPVY